VAYLVDGTSDFSLGQDAWHAPDRIQPTQYARGVNVTTKRGTLSPRPGFWDKTLVFQQGSLKTDFGYFRSYEDIWRGGKFQAAIPFPQGPDNFIITVVSGLIFKINVLTLAVSILSTEIKLNQYASRINWSYAAGKIVLFDYPDYPVIIDGNKLTRASQNHKIGTQPAPQVPISVLGAYNQNRLFVANAGVEFTAGDPVGDLATPEAPITFTEVFTPSSDFFRQVFSLPVDEALYPITAMGFLQQIDANTGIGPMFIASQKKVYYYRTDQPRTNWGQGEFGEVLLANAGMPGPRAFVNVNSDIVFLSGEGKLHAMSTSRNDTQRWGDVPISREVDDFLKFNDPSLIRLAVLGYFDNHIYISANPYRIQALDRSQRPVTDYAHGGFVILEIDQISSFLEQGSPVWAGLWTGINPMEFVTVGDRAFVFSKDGCGTSGFNALYEIKRDATYDIVRGIKRRVRSIVEFKEWTFEDPFKHKRENALTLHIDGLRGVVDLLLHRRTSDSPGFLEYAEWHHTAPTEICDEMPPDELINGMQPHNFREIVFGDPRETGCNPVTLDLLDTFRSVQVRMTIEADSWILKELRMKAQDVPFEERQERIGCDGGLAVRIPAECETYWNIPEVQLCQ
jgi:hypothetical protein